MHNVDPNSSVWLFLLAIIVISWLFYLLPSIIAFICQHPHKWYILLVNFFLGCSVFGWFVALFWSLGFIFTKEGTKRNNK